MDLAVPPELIERRIYLIRGQKVILDSDLADLYEVPTKALNQALKRNLDRFPADFAFQLNQQEWTSLRSQAVTSRSWGGRRYPPYAFAEQGVAMLSSVRQRLPDVLVLQLGVISSKLLPRVVGAQGLEHAAHREAQPADAGLAIHFSDFDSDPVENS